MMLSVRWVTARLRSTTIVLVAIASLALAATSDAGDGVQFDSFCDRTYVNKKVGENEQWAITWQIFGNASGNVFKLDGSAPSFIECELVDEDDENEIFNCYGSSACSGPPCGDTQWTLIASEIAIPTTFFLPPGVDPVDPVASCVEFFP
jgi:hypothetical protein